MRLVDFQKRVSKSLLILVFSSVAVLSLHSRAFSRDAVVILTNEDALSGDIVRQEQDGVLLYHSTLGEIFISNVTILEVLFPETDTETDGKIQRLSYQDRIDRALKEDTRERGSVAWERSLNAGMGLTMGNTELFNAIAGININRNRLWIDEWNLKARGEYRSDKGEKVFQRIEGSLRYGYSFTKKFYGFLSVSALNDYSTLLDISLTPNAGVGYWVVDIKDFIGLMGEVSGGYNLSYYESGEETQTPIMVARLYYMWVIFPGFVFKEDFRYTPSIPDFSDFRIRNRASLVSGITEKLGLVLSYDLSYHSKPLEGVENLDHSFNVSLKWDF
jgi:putative salt-induced outer membrane protein YdiY